MKIIIWGSALTAFAIMAAPAPAQLLGGGGLGGGLGGSLGGSLGQLALAGSNAANASGSFDVAPGMLVQDVRGRAIGTVQSVRSTANGTVEAVVMKVGDATATLPAANFSGSGNILFSAMGKGEVKKAAKENSGKEGSGGKQAAGSGSAKGSASEKQAAN